MKKSGDEDFEKGRKKIPVDSTGILMSIYDFEICDYITLTPCEKFLNCDIGDIFTLCPGCGAWMYDPPPTYIPMCPGP